MGISNGKLTDKKVRNATVIVDILPNGRCIPGSGLNPTRITIHDTGNTGAAKNQHNYLKNNNKPSGDCAKASWHFAVDDKYIVQSVQTNKKAWHAGKGNSYSIGIEISQRSTAEAQKEAYLNAVALVKVLQKAYGINNDRVVRHKDWTGKDCPYNLNHNKFGYNWEWFKRQIKSGATTTQKEEEDEEVEKIVTYYGDADVFSAILVAQKNKCALMKETDFKISGIKAKQIIKIGGNAEDINRFQTAKNAASKYL